MTSNFIVSFEQTEMCYQDLQGNDKIFINKFNREVFRKFSFNLDLIEDKRVNLIVT